VKNKHLGYLLKNRNEFAKGMKINEVKR